jgi:uncharacterized protein (TIGR02145 family)
MSSAVVSILRHDFPCSLFWTSPPCWSAFLPSPSKYAGFIDPRDLRTYKTVVIGTQTWMAQNLDFGTLDSATSTLQSGSVKYCHMNLQVNCATEGGLYQWHYAMGLPDSCATTYCSNLINLDNGWHMPDSADWDSLGTALGGLDEVGRSYVCRGCSRHAPGIVTR